VTITESSNSTLSGCTIQLSRRGQILLIYHGIHLFACLLLFLDHYFFLSNQQSASSEDEKVAAAITVAFRARVEYCRLIAIS